MTRRRGSYSRVIVRISSPSGLRISISYSSPEWLMAIEPSSRRTQALAMSSSLIEIEMLFPVSFCVLESSE